MIRRACLALLVLLLSPVLSRAQTQTTFTGNLSSIGTPGSDLLQVRITLANCGNATPNIPGVTMPITNQITLTANPSGLVSTPIWGNTVIQCNGSTSTVYQVSYLRNYVLTGVSAYYRVDNAVPFNLNTATPVTALPPIGKIYNGFTCATGLVMTGITSGFRAVCALPLSTMLNDAALSVATSAILGQPAASQQVLEPAGSSLGVNSLNGVLNAQLFTGADICARTNAAAAAALASMTQPGGSGEANIVGKVEIPPGNYTCNTVPIKVPHGVWIAGAGDATYINWTGTGPAVIASDVGAGGETITGYLTDVHLHGSGGTTQVGIYVGGDSTCTETCATNPSTNAGYNYVFRNLTIFGMGSHGVQYGNAAFNLLFDNVRADNNGGYGLYVPPTATGGGQYNTWTHSQFAGNKLGGWLINQLPEVTFEMIGVDVQYNAANSTATTPETVGGHVICTGCHFEHYQGPFFVLNPSGSIGGGDDIQMVGGQLLSVGATGVDPYLVQLNGAGRWSQNGTYMLTNHDITILATVADPVHASLSVFGTTMLSVSHYFGGVTSAAGQGIRYEQPIDPATQSPNTNGSRYFGGITNTDTINATKTIGTTANGSLWSTLPVNGNFMGWNESQTDGEADYYNPYSHAADATTVFSFWGNIAGVKTLMGYIQHDKTLAGMKIRSSDGASGTCTKTTVASGTVTACTDNTNTTPQVTTPTAGQAACIKVAGPPVIIGYCSTTVSSSGACTCN